MYEWKVIEHLCPQVALDSGETVAANVVVLGVGVVPNTDFLASSNIPRDDRGFVPVNEVCIFIGSTLYKSVYCTNSFIIYWLCLLIGVLLYCTVASKCPF